MIKVKRIQCLISEGVQRVCEREKHKSSEMDRTRERWYHMTIVSQISFPDKSKFGPKQTNGHTGWDFPVPQAWKEIHVCLLAQKNPKKTKNKNNFIVKQVSFISWNQCRPRWLNHRGPKPMNQPSVCWSYSCLEYTETVLLFSDTGWGGAAARRLCSSGLPLHEESHGITLPCTREAYQS